MFPPFEYRDSSGVPRRFFLQEERGSSDGSPTIAISIWQNPSIVIGTSSYHARFKYLDGTTVSVDWVGNNENEWAKRIGLSEAVFTYVARHYAVTIVSSR